MNTRPEHLYPDSVAQVEPLAEILAPRTPADGKEPLWLPRFQKVPG